MPRLTFAVNQVVTAEQINELLGQTVRYYDTEEDRAAAYRLLPPTNGECSTLGTSPGRIDYWTDGVGWRAATGRTFEWLISQAPQPRAVPPVTRGWAGGGPAVRAMAAEYGSDLIVGNARRLESAQAIIGRDISGMNMRSEDDRVFSTRQQARAARLIAYADLLANDRVVIEQGLTLHEAQPREAPLVVWSISRDDATNTPGTFDTRVLAQAALDAIVVPEGAVVSVERVYAQRAGVPMGEETIVRNPGYPAGFPTEAAARADLRIAIEALPDDVEVTDSDAESAPGDPGAETTSAPSGPLLTEAAAQAARDAAIAALPPGTTVASDESADVVFSEIEYGAWEDDSSGSETSGPYGTLPSARTSYLAAFNALDAAVRNGGSAANDDALTGTLDDDNGPQRIEATYSSVVTTAPASPGYATEALARAALAAATPANAQVVESDVTETRPAVRSGTRSSSGVAATPAAVNTAIAAAVAALPAGANIVRQTVAPAGYTGLWNMWWWGEVGNTNVAESRTSGPQTSSAAAQAVYNGQTDTRSVPARGANPTPMKDWIEGYTWPALSEVRTSYALSEHPGGGDSRDNEPDLKPLGNAAEVTLAQVLANPWNTGRKVIKSGTFSVAVFGDQRWIVELNTGIGTGATAGGSYQSTSSTPLTMPSTTPVNLSLDAMRATFQTYRNQLTYMPAATSMAVIAAIPSGYRWTIEYTAEATPGRWDYTLTYRNQLTPARFWYRLRWRPITTAQGWYWTITTIAGATATVWTWFMTTRSSAIREGGFTFELVYRPATTFVGGGWSYWFLISGTQSIARRVSHPWFRFVCSDPATGNLLIGLSERDDSNSVGIWEFDPRRTELGYSYRAHIDISRTVSDGFPIGVSPVTVGIGVIAFAIANNARDGWVWKVSDLPGESSPVFRLLPRRTLAVAGSGGMSFLALTTGHLDARNRAVYGTGAAAPEMHEAVPAWQRTTPLQGLVTETVDVGAAPVSWRRALSVIPYADGIGQAVAGGRPRARPRRLLGLLIDGSIREIIASGTVTGSTVFAERTLLAAGDLPHSPTVGTPSAPPPSPGPRRMLGLAQTGDGALWTAVAVNGSAPVAWLHQIGRGVPV